MKLTPKQRRLRTEIEALSSIIGVDHWRIYKYPSQRRTFLLMATKDKLVRGEVISKYAVIDELLTDIICNYYLPRLARERTFQRGNKADVREIPWRLGAQASAWACESWHPPRVYS
jgi:hypothetical protein